VLVLVGDLRPGAALDTAESALGSWAPGGGAPGLEPPAPPAAGPTLIVDRPGAVQTNIRIGGPAVGRGHPLYPGLALANLVFGGYFTSRLVENIRERRGYTYSPGSGVTQLRSAAHLMVAADVATEVTAPALLEMRYELCRMVSAPAEADELTAAKRYLSGTMSTSVQTQAGLASYLSTLAARDLPITYLRDLPREVERLGPGDVLEAARRFMSPKRLTTVMVGDAAAIRDDVEATDEVEVVTR
jgi:zinc protease